MHSFLAALRCAIRPVMLPTFFFASFCLAFLTFPAAVIADGYHYIGSIGSPIPSQFDQMDAITTDRQGSVYVADDLNIIRKYDRAGKFLLKIGHAGAAAGEFKWITGLATDQYLNLYVADAGNCRIQKFDRQGKFLMQFGSFGLGDGQFGIPTGVAVNFSGDIFVADGKRFLIHRFDRNARFLSAFGPNATYLGNPPVMVRVSLVGSNVATLNLTGEPNSDPNFPSVGVYDLNGNRLLGFGRYGDSNGGLQSPFSLAIDRNGRFLVGDTVTGPVVAFDKKGVYQETLAKPALNEKFPFPAGVAADIFGDIWVADGNNSRIIRIDHQTKNVALSFGAPAYTPRALTLDSSNNLYLTEFDNGRITRFAPYGTPRFLFELPLDRGQPAQMGGILLTGNLITVTDNQRKQVLTFDQSGVLQSAFGQYGYQEDQFITPDNLARDSAGNFYVADSPGLKKFDATGKFLRAFYVPYFTNRVTIDAADNIFVTTRNWYDSAADSQVVKLDPTGKELLRLGADDTDGNVHSDYNALTTDAQGSLFAADSKRQRVVKFDANGKKVADFGDAGAFEEKIGVSYGIAVDNAGKVYVSDYTHRRIAVFAPDSPKLDVIRTPRPKVARDKATGELRITLSVTNTGTGTAQAGRITSASLNGTATLAALPFALPPIPAGGATDITLRFPGSAADQGTPGTLAIFLIADGVKTYAAVRTDRIP